MTPTHAVANGAALVELLAAVVIVVHVVRALWLLLTGRRLDDARLVLAEGVLAALAFSLAATLLKVIGLQQWAQIRAFAIIFCLRTLLKRVFLQERKLAAQRCT